MGLRFDREIEYVGKVALNCMFSYIGFSYYRCTSATFRKRIEQLLPQSLEPILSVFSIICE